MAKKQTGKVSKLTKPIEDMTEDERKARILEILRIAAPRFSSGEVDFENSTVTLFVPPPRDMDPKASLQQRQFFAENGVTKLERATLDYLLAGELRAYANGVELSLQVNIEGASKPEAELEAEP